VTVAIVTDSTADLPPELTASRSITVVPLTLNFDGKSLLDGVDIRPDEFYRGLPSVTTHPTTSQPSVGRFAEAYSSLLADHDAVVSIHISEKLSGTYSSARQAAEMTDPKRVRVVDSEKVSMSLGLITLVASSMAGGGAEAETIEAKVLDMRQHVQTYFSVATLEYLRRGGRIGRASALLGSVLQVKPVLCIRDGLVTPLERVRTFERALNRILELTREIDALEAELPNSQARSHIADVRRRIETLYEMLRENRQLLETILENSAANIYAKRRDGRYIYLNHEMEVTCDVTREKALGRTDFELFPREMAEQNRTNDLAAMMTGKLTEAEERVIGPSGERLFLAKKVPLISSNGKVEGMCGISTDITDLRRTELALREAVITLKGERDNKLMNIEAVTASIAHEVRQPLAAIAINCSAAQRFLERVPLDIDEVRAILNGMMGDCHRVSEVFDTIRALFRRVDHKREPTVVNEIVLDVLQSMREELTDHGVTTETELAPELPRVDGHRSQLRQVIFNLIHNAIESMDNTMDRSRVLRVITKSHGPDAIIVAVDDSGPGINPRRLSSIFDPFITTKPDGMGLGLAICRMIVERHDGKLSALSDGKNGARFQVVLPVRLTDGRRPEVTD